MPLSREQSPALTPVPDPDPRPNAGPAGGSRLWPASLVLLGACLLGFVLLPTQADNDLWGHLRFGLDILQTHAIPRIDLYSFTEAHAPWIDDEWLSELLYGIAWKAAGAAGLVALKILAGLLTGALCFWHLRRTGIPGARAGLTLLMLIVLLPPLSMVRPLDFTLPAFALTLIVIYRAESEGGIGLLWTLPPLFAVWVNLHGGVLAGLAVLGWWAAARFLLDRSILAEKLWRIALPVAATFAATCLNPYGWHLPVFLVHAASGPRPEITEWQPLQITSAYGAMYAAVLGVSIAGFVFSRRKKDPVLLGLFAIVALLPFAALRHVPLAALGAVVLAGPDVADLWKRLAHASPESIAIPRWAPVLPLLCATALILGAARRPVRITVSGQYPVKAAGILKASGVEGPLIHRFDWGEYLLWKLGPRVKVMIDGRRETVYSEDVYQSYLRFQKGTGDWDSLIRPYRPDMALLEANSVSANLFRLKPEWTEVYTDGVAAIFARRGSEAESRLRRAAAASSPAAYAPASGPFLFP